MPRYFDSAGICVYCEILEYEIKDQKRVILENNSFIAIVPFAASVPYETWIIPKRHIASFGKINDKDKKDFVEILQKTLDKFYRILNNPDFNYVIHSAPYPLSEVPFYHWHLQILPRIQTPGGFEVGTRISVNPVTPEESAKKLKE